MAALTFASCWTGARSAFGFARRPARRSTWRTVMPPRAIRRAEFEALLCIGDGEQCTAVAGGEAPFLEEILDRLIEFQQADGVGDGGAVFSGALGDFLLRRLNSSVRRWKARACSIGLRSSRWRFSTSVISSAISSGTSRTTTGTR